MKRSSFRKLTWEEAIAKQASKNAKVIGKAKIAKGNKKRSTGQISGKKGVRAPDSLLSNPSEQNVIIF